MGQRIPRWWQRRSRVREESHGVAPTKLVMVTIPDPSISADAFLYTLTSDGGLVPMKAIVSTGRAVVSFTSDLAHGNKTTYMPIWYVTKMLKTLNISSSWNGTTWTLTNNATQSGKTNGTNYEVN